MLKIFSIDSIVELMLPIFHISLDNDKKDSTRAILPDLDENKENFTVQLFGLASRHHPDANIVRYHVQ
jgi:hypothetical protein